MSEEHNEEEEEGSIGGGWLISYADLMTLLFAAFVVLFGITPQGESDEILGVASSIRESFVEIPDEILEVGRQAELFSGKLIFTAAKPDAIHPPNIKRFNRQQNELSGKNLNLDEVEVLLNQASKGDGVQTSLAQGIKVARHEYGFRLILFDEFMFERGSLKLSESAKEYLIKISKILGPKPFDFQIEGHSSNNVAPELTPFEAAAIRGSAVSDYMIRAGKIEANRINLATYGSLRSTQSGHIDPKTFRDDRVEIKIRKRTLSSE